MQGRACVFDLIRNPATDEVLLADSDAGNLALAKRMLASPKVRVKTVDASDPAAVRRLAKGYDVLVSCVPYFLNLKLAKAAVAAKIHFIDLGGNTDIVLEELKLHSAAKRAGITIIPDVGLGPGMTTTIAEHGIRLFDETHEVRIRDGGLPRKPRPPMNYMLTFSEHGLINEYVEDATALRDFKRVKVPGLSEVESIEIPGLGTMEAGHASGGLSTLAHTYEGKIRTMDCKLIRYPGHCAVINSMNAMGFFSKESREIGKARLSPRELSAKLFREHFDHQGDEDLVVIHTTVSGIKDGRKARIVYDMRADYDAKNKLTAMMQTTAFPASIVARMLADKTIDKPGAYPVERGVPPEPFFAEMKRRGFNLSWKLSLSPPS